MLKIFIAGTGNHSAARGNIQHLLVVTIMSFYFVLIVV